MNLFVYFLNVIILFDTYYLLNISLSLFQPLNNHSSYLKIIKSTYQIRYLFIINLFIYIAIVIGTDLTVNNTPYSEN